MIDLKNDDLDAIITAPLRTTPAPLAKAQAFEQPCSRCGGSGRYGNLGSCFKCGGSGRLTFKTAPEARAKDRAGAAKRKARTTAESLEAFAAAHPDVWAWIDGNDFGFAIAMREAIAKWGSLTERQMAACRSAMGKLAEARAASAARVAEAKPIDMTAIEAAFARAGAKLKAPRLTVAGLTIYPAKAGSKNAGSLYVRGASAAGGDREYLGKISGGKFIRSRECSAEREAELLATAADPKAAAVKYGRLTGRCAICGRTLSNADSVALGIGPVCAENFGW